MLEELGFEDALWWLDEGRDGGGLDLPGRVRRLGFVAFAGGEVSLLGPATGGGDWAILRDA